MLLLPQRRPTAEPLYLRCHNNDALHASLYTFARDLPSVRSLIEWQIDALDRFLLASVYEDLQISSHCSLDMSARSMGATNGMRDLLR